MSRCLGAKDHEVVEVRKPPPGTCPSNQVMTGSSFPPDSILNITVPETLVVYRYWNYPDSSRWAVFYAYFTTYTLKLVDGYNRTFDSVKDFLRT